MVCVLGTAYGPPEEFCETVAARSSDIWAIKGPAGQAEKWERVDWKRFDGACDEWERLGDGASRSALDALASKVEE